MEYNIKNTTLMYLKALREDLEKIKPYDKTKTLWESFNLCALLTRTLLNLKISVVVRAEMKRVLVAMLYKEYVRQCIKTNEPYIKDSGYLWWPYTEEGYHSRINFLNVFIERLEKNQPF